MHTQNLDKWIARGKADGYRFLLICFDTFDAIRGDADGGYYPVYVASIEEVRTEVSKRQTGEWLATDVRDFCEFVVDLNAEQTTLILPSRIADLAVGQKD